MHRDVTPNNMLINMVGMLNLDIPDYNMYLSDFGLAVNICDIDNNEKDYWHGDHSYFTAPEITKYYSSENGNKPDKPDSKADVFQLGLSFIVILSPYSYSYPKEEKDLEDKTAIEKQIYYWENINKVRQKLRISDIPSIFIPSLVDKDIYYVIKELLYNMTEEDVKNRVSIDEVLARLQHLTHIINLRFDDSLNKFLSDESSDESSDDSNDDSNDDNIDM
eukprot:GHVR01191582.1.p1 GENE.GHVR01191582.1~~GHVR01191582.1.p1  ORF type:complete len:220 (+),score=53.03 GHVR01191582.1:1-660(+)